MLNFTAQVSFTSQSDAGVKENDVIIKTMASDIYAASKKVLNGFSNTINPSISMIWESRQKND